MSISSRDTAFPVIYVRGSGISVQGPAFWAIPVASRLHQSHGGGPCSPERTGYARPQLPRRLAHNSKVSRAVVRTQGPGAQAPQPVGSSGQLGKEQTRANTEDLFSRHGVGFGQPDSTPDPGSCSVGAELPQDFIRQDGGPTETFSESFSRSRYPDILWYSRMPQPPAGEPRTMGTQCQGYGQVPNCVGISIASSCWQYVLPWDAFGGKDVLVRTDNVTTVAYINWQGGLRPRRNSPTTSSSEGQQKGKAVSKPEDGPVYSGCHHLGLRSTRCALPTQVACSLH